MIPKKKKGFRKIVVDEKTYTWRFSKIIEIRPEENKANKLEIDFGYIDSWLYANDDKNSLPDFEPKIITPRFIKESIENGIKLGWDVNAKNGIKKLNYKSGVFELI